MLNFHIVFHGGGIPLDMSTNGRLWLPFLRFIQQTWEVFCFLFFDTGFYVTSSLPCSLYWLWSDRPASVSHALEWQVCHHAFSVERRRKPCEADGCLFFVLWQRNCISLLCLRRKSLFLSEESHFQERSGGEGRGVGELKQARGQTLNSGKRLLIDWPIDWLSYWLIYFCVLYSLVFSEVVIDIMVLLPTLETPSIHIAKWSSGLQCDTTNPIRALLLNKSLFYPYPHMPVISRFVEKEGTVPQSD